MTCIDRVKEFWEESPLWTGESKYQVGSIDFFKNTKGFTLKIVLLVHLIHAFYLQGKIQNL